MRTWRPDLKTFDNTAIAHHATRREFTAPFFYWFPAVSPSGFIFYTGNRYKDWQGNILFGALSAETLVRLELKGDHVAAEERICVNRRIRDVIQAPDGTVLLLSDGAKGELLRLAPPSSSTQWATACNILGTKKTTNDACGSTS